MKEFIKLTKLSNILIKVLNEGDCDKLLDAEVIVPDILYEINNIYFNLYQDKYYEQDTTKKRPLIKFITGLQKESVIKVFKEYNMSLEDFSDKVVNLEDIDLLPINHNNKESLLNFLTHIIECSTAVLLDYFELNCAIQTGIESEQSLEFKSLSEEVDNELDPTDYTNFANESITLDTLKHIKRQYNVILLSDIGEENLDIIDQTNYGTADQFIEFMDDNKLAREVNKLIEGGDITND